MMATDDALEASQCVVFFKPLIRRRKWEMRLPSTWDVRRMRGGLGGNKGGGDRGAEREL